MSENGKIVDPNNLNELFNIIDKDAEVLKPEDIDPNSMDNVNKELIGLIQNGKYILEACKQTVESNLDNPELVSASAKMLDSIRETLKEFTRVHYSRLKHEQNKEFELIKLAGKKQLLDQKIKAMRELNPGNTGNGTVVDAVPLHSFSQEDMVRKILDEQKEQKKLV